MAEQCPFIWYELMTTNRAAAKVFYGGVVGWQAMPPPNPAPGMPYELLALPGQMPGAGLMDLPAPAAAMGVPPNWLGYVAVPDLAAALAKATGLGARVVVPMTEVPGMLHFACITDPQGAALGMLTPINPPADARPDYTSLGRVGWHELYALDGASAFGFYAAMFGWEKGVAMDMGPMGTYQIFTLNGAQIGGMMTKPAAMPMPAWGYYINLADVDAALAAIGAGGGRVIHGPQQVPGGGWILQALDPQGAAFAVVGPRPNQPKA